MSAHEIWDYLSATPVTPDCNITLDVTPQTVLFENGSKNQVVHVGDDDSESIITFSDTSIFFVTLQFNKISESDAGTIFDLYHDPAKGNGIARSFKWSHSGASDVHVYTVRFDSALPRSIRSALRFGFGDVRLKILGRSA